MGGEHFSRPLSGPVSGVIAMARGDRAVSLPVKWT